MDNNYMQYLQYQEQQDKKKANILCTLSLILGFLGTIVLPVILAGAESWFDADSASSEFISELLATANMIPFFLTGMCTLTGIVLMIIARVKYPRSTYAKVVMWIYIVGIIIYVILVIIALGALFTVKTD